MDLSLILSMVAIVVSVSMTIITLLFTEFRGPNISLLKIPKFQVTDEDSRARLKGDRVVSDDWFFVRFLAEENVLSEKNKGKKCR